MSITPISHATGHNLHGHAYTLKENYLGKIVEWIRKDRPLYQQVFVYTLVAIGVLVLIPVFPILIAFYNEYDNQSIQSKVNAGDNEIYKVFGDKEAFGRLHSRKIKDLNWDTLHTLPSSVMDESIERTKDTFERPGVLLRLLDNRTKKVFVQAVYRKFMYEPVWDYSRGPVAVFRGPHMDDEDLLRLQLILNNRHNRFSLC